MKQLHIYIPENLYESLRKEAFENRTSISKVIVDKLSPKYVISGKVKVTDIDLTARPHAAIKVSSVNTVKKLYPKVLTPEKSLCTHGYPPEFCKVWACSHHKSGGEEK